LHTTSFTKRIYSLPSFIESVRDVFDHMDDLRTASRSGRISKTFAEKIMLTVTRVNGCRYCSYGHSRAALAAGVSHADLQKLMTGELGAFPETEAIALMFAQHFAESQCKPDPAAWQRVVDYYGLDTARDILAYLRMITFGNLFGNTFDAVLSRFVGKPAAGSNLFGELSILLGGFIVVPFGMVIRLLPRLLTYLIKPT
jgi:AhpD family alkylhydroperoxidase